MPKRWRPLFFRWIKFSAVGWLGVSVQLTMLTLLAGRLEMHYLVATALAVQCAILNNFFWHERWTWGDRGLLGAPGRWQRFLRFNATSGTLSILGNVVFMSIYVGQLGLHYLVGNIASIASCTILNFVISDRLVFLAMPTDTPASCE
jgi:dolichol-phosphate mannosyltransferase